MLYLYRCFLFIHHWQCCCSAKVPFYLERLFLIYQSNRRLFFWPSHSLVFSWRIYLCKTGAPYHRQLARLLPTSGHPRCTEIVSSPGVAWQEACCIWPPAICGEFLAWWSQASRCCRCSKDLPVWPRWSPRDHGRHRGHRGGSWCSGGHFRIQFLCKCVSVEKKNNKKIKSRDNA